MSTFLFPSRPLKLLYRPDTQIYSYRPAPSLPATAATESCAANLSLTSAVMTFYVEVPGTSRQRDLLLHRETIRLQTMTSLHPEEQIMIWNDPEITRLKCVYFTIYELKAWNVWDRTAGLMGPIVTTCGPYWDRSPWLCRRPNTKTARNQATNIKRPIYTTCAKSLVHIRDRD